MAEATQQVMEEPADAHSRCTVVRGATGEKVVASPWGRKRRGKDGGDTRVAAAILSLSEVRKGVWTILFPSKEVSIDISTTQSRAVRESQAPGLRGWSQDQ